MDSESSTTQQTSQYDNRNVLGERATLAQGGSTIIQNTLDADVANRAIDSSTKNLDMSLNFGTGAMTKTIGFAGDALKSIVTGQDRALDAVADSNSMVKDAYADAKGRGAMTDQITIAAIALAGLVAFAAVKGKSA